MTSKNEGPYLIMKRGLYYKPNSCGYTGVKDRAGRYSLTETAVHFPNVSDSGLSYIHEDEAPDYSEACWDDVKQEHIIEKKDAEILALKNEILELKSA